MHATLNTGAPANQTVVQKVERELMAAADARGGPDNSAITERGIRGLFYMALELASTQMWSRRIGLYFPSDTKTEKHRWLGNVAEPRKHFGGLNANPLNDYGIDATNEDYENTLEIALRDWERDKTGQAVRKLAELAVSWEDHWNKLAVDVLENNDTAYDGQALFSGSHAIGSSGTMDNDLASGDIPSLNVSATNRPTKAEAAAILHGLAAYMFTYKDDAGRPANQGASNFLAVVPPVALPGYRQAIRDALYVQGGSNELANLGWSFDVVAEPRLASSDVIYFFRTDGMSAKPLMPQEEKAPSIQVVGRGSGHTIKIATVLYVSKARRVAFPGEFGHVIKVTLS